MKFHLTVVIDPKLIRVILTSLVVLVVNGRLLIDQLKS